MIIIDNCSEWIEHLLHYLNLKHCYWRSSWYLHRQNKMKWKKHIIGKNVYWHLFSILNRCTNFVWLPVGYSCVYVFGIMVYRPRELDLKLFNSASSPTSSSYHYMVGIARHLPFQALWPQPSVCTNILLSLPPKKADDDEWPRTRPKNGESKIIGSG